MAVTQSQGPGLLLDAREETRGGSGEETHRLKTCLSPGDVKKFRRSACVWRVAALVTYCTPADKMGSRLDLQRKKKKKTKLTMLFPSSLCEYVCVCGWVCVCVFTPTLFRKRKKRNFNFSFEPYEPCVVMVSTKDTRGTPFSFSLLDHGGQYDGISTCSVGRAVHTEDSNPHSLVDINLDLVDPKHSACFFPFVLESRLTFPKVVRLARVLPLNGVCSLNNGGHFSFFLWGEC
ncbi:hypothetical protein AALO_G00220990 [Alosa alosa]|uniref:Uncharacterized protein n=1 Tax=Alosa alosa TaxID=278164 RepID=A0AAV6G1K5_9TELE|nr:hypothetical protein AALO_G00220990 [Alosa alosa]